MSPPNHTPLNVGSLTNVTQVIFQRTFLDLIFLFLNNSVFFRSPFFSNSLRWLLVLVARTSWFGSSLAWKISALRVTPVSSRRLFIYYVNGVLMFSDDDVTGKDVCWSGCECYRVIRFQYVNNMFTSSKEGVRIVSAKHVSSFSVFCERSQNHLSFCFVFKLVNLLTRLIYQLILCLSIYQYIYLMDSFKVRSFHFKTFAIKWSKIINLKYIFNMMNQCTNSLQKKKSFSSFCYSSQFLVVNASKELLSLFDAPPFFLPISSQ